jgi:TolA-binding protein
MAKNKLVKGKNYISFEKDEKKSIIIALVVSAAVVLAVVIAIICIKRGVGVPVGSTTSEEVIDTYTVTENVTEDGSVIVTNQEELDTKLSASLEDSSIGSITIQSEDEQSIEIPAGDYSQVALNVDAPYTEVANYANFNSININQISSNTWVEHATGNNIVLQAASSHVVIESDASVDSLANISYGSTLAVEIYGTVKELSLEADESISSVSVYGTLDNMSIYSKTNLALSGDGNLSVPIKVQDGAAGSILKTSVPIKMDSCGTVDVYMESGAEGSQITLTSGDVLSNIFNNSEGEINVTDPDGNVNVLNTGDTGSYGEIKEPEPAQTPDTSATGGGSNSSSTVSSGSRNSGSGGSSNNNSGGATTTTTTEPTITTTTNTTSTPSQQNTTDASKKTQSSTSSTTATEAKNKELTQKVAEQEKEAKSLKEQIESITKQLTQQKDETDKKIKEATEEIQEIKKAQEEAIKEAQKNAVLSDDLLPNGLYKTVAEPTGKVVSRYDDPYIKEIGRIPSGNEDDSTAEYIIVKNDIEPENEDKKGTSYLVQLNYYYFKVPEGETEIALVDHAHSESAVLKPGDEWIFDRPKSTKEDTSYIIEIAAVENGEGKKLTVEDFSLYPNEKDSVVIAYDDRDAIVEDGAHYMQVLFTKDGQALGLTQYNMWLENNSVKANWTSDDNGITFNLETIKFNKPLPNEENVKCLVFIN